MMNEWEQMKKEYREIPIPEQGVHQVMEAMARAKQQKTRERWRKLTRYGTVAAAILIVFLLPGILFMSGGFGASMEDSAAVEADKWTESTGAGAAFDSSEKNFSSSSKAESSEYSSENKTDTTADSYWPENSGGSGQNKAEQPEQGNSNSCMEDKAEVPVEGSPVTEATKGNLKEILEAKAGFLQSLEEISEEILRQMEVRGEQGEIFYLKSEEYPSGYEKISEEQEYYINEDGLFVVVFEPGTVAPASAGVVEFVIPAEVAAP